MNYYFYHTVLDGTRNRLHALPYQVDSNGVLIMTDLNCQVSSGGMKIREAYSIGTVFCSEKCELSSRNGTPYIVAGDIYPILPENGQSYLYDYPLPKKEMTAAYRKYLEAVPACELAKKMSEGIVGIIGPDERRLVVTRQPNIMASFTGNKEPLNPISVKSVYNLDLARLDKRKLAELVLPLWKIDPEYAL